MGEQQQGFTLVELIVVIVILGILAATALPRFINVTQDAREASVKGFAGGVTSSAALVQAKWVAGGGGAGPIQMADNTTVVITALTGLPTSADVGIGAAVRCNATDCNGFTANYALPAAGSTTFTLNGSTTCTVVYVAATGAVTANATGCS